MVGMVVPMVVGGPFFPSMSGRMSMLPMLIVGMLFVRMFVIGMRFVGRMPLVSTMSVFLMGMMLVLHG